MRNGVLGRARVDQTQLIPKPLPLWIVGRDRVEQTLSGSSDAHILTSGMLSATNGRTPRVVVEAADLDPSTRCYSSSRRTHARLPTHAALALPKLLTAYALSILGHMTYMLYGITLRFCCFARE